ncbi:hypothetical protein O9992_03835 [Vibrio lentus]|nr:hypothetical protein [Vibrio lentus]
MEEVKSYLVIYVKRSVCLSLSWLLAINDSSGKSADLNIEKLRADESKWYLENSMPSFRIAKK